MKSKCDDWVRGQYEVMKSDIKGRLEEFRRFGQEASREDLFAEVAYCICSRMGGFRNCRLACEQMRQNNVLYSQGVDTISLYLKRNYVRFYSVRAMSITAARAELYDNGCQHEIKGLVAQLLSMPQQEARDYLHRLHSGLGIEESSHFLRNVGHGDDLAILAIPIIDKLVECGILAERMIGIAVSDKYMAIEEIMREWANELGISLGELDLLLWSEETGELFR